MALRFEQMMNKNVNIKISAHGAFLDYPSAGTLKIERLENQKPLNFGSNKAKGPKQDSQIQLRSPMPDGGEP